MKKEKQVIGWREWIQLPEFVSSRIKAKIDTGARTSAIHAEDIEIFLKNGKKWVRFRLLPKQRSDRKSQMVEAEMIEKRKIRSSVGHETIRPVVKTKLRIGHEEIAIELTLVNRDIMGFRMLVGRQAIRKNYLVNPGRSFLAGLPHTLH